MNPVASESRLRRKSSGEKILPPWEIPTPGASRSGGADPAAAGATQSAAERLSAAMKRSESAPGLARGADLAPVLVGVAAMDKKARSKQMRAIVERLERFGEFKAVVFGDEALLNQPVEAWPRVQALLSWHSEGFPLAKAAAYVALRRPFCVNDSAQQSVLLDRRAVYRRLRAAGIPVPTHVIVDRDSLPEGVADPPGFVEHEDYVEMDGARIAKPFVEKPASGEDHNIWVYYPHAQGGGVKRLFRKVDNRSAEYLPDHPGAVRRGGSFIYEEFLPTGGTDVKVYTVGPRYAHAEARKSPVVDGKVQRTPDGKEVRFPVLLSPAEKEIARAVTLTFGQRVCGFDLLRTERGRSYVCDVNGWSFVKNSHKYYDDAAGILRMLILSAVAPHRLLAAPAPPPLSVSDAAGGGAGGAGADGGAGALSPEATARGAAAAALAAAAAGPGAATGGGAEALDGQHADEELRCVLAVVRHGDRTPKQKMKMRVTAPPLLGLLHRYMDSKGKQAKLKSPLELQELLDVTRALVEASEAEARARAAAGARPDAEADEARERLRIVRSVLEQGGQFAGINRKVQLKPLAWAEPEAGAEAGGGAAGGTPPPRRAVEALLILKHGGVLTHAGRAQAQALGQLFRASMYPHAGPAGGGLLRLHSTYRHDLKIYSSDEGRVQMSAAAFTKGLLDLEGGALTPILVSLVKKDAGMLDAFGKGASADILAAKAEVYAAMTRGGAEAAAPPAPSPPSSPPPAGRGGGVGGGGAAAAAVQLAAAAAAAGPPRVRPLPADPPGELRRLRALLAQLVDALRQRCLEEPRPPSSGSSGNGSAPTLERPPSSAGAAASAGAPGADAAPPTEGAPCGGERLLLMFDRWRKLAKAFYDDKRGAFDISKVPDIYDAAKYDATHNAGLLPAPLGRELHRASRALAEAVVPNEYGVAPCDKLRVGSTIAARLLGKLLADLASMREESVATSAGIGGGGGGAEAEAGVGALALGEKRAPGERGGGGGGLADFNSLDARRFGDNSNGGAAADSSSLGGSAPPSRGGTGDPSRLASAADETGAEGGGDGGGAAAGSDGEGGVAGGEDDDGVLHRLCPTYAQDVNSPLRHVRTRIYFTSESHCHALMNVLRFCHLAPGGTGAAAALSPADSPAASAELPPLARAAAAPPPPPAADAAADAAAPLLSPDGRAALSSCRELDYMTHFVLRMFESTSAPLGDPRRFRVEILFSPGAAVDPFDLSDAARPAAASHVLPVRPRAAVDAGGGRGVPLAALDAALKPHAKPFSRAPDDPAYPALPPLAPGGPGPLTAAAALDYWM